MKARIASMTWENPALMALMAVLLIASVTLMATDYMRISAFLGSPFAADPEASRFARVGLLYLSLAMLLLFMVALLAYFLGRAAQGEASRSHSAGRGSVRMRITLESIFLGGAP